MVFLFLKFIPGYDEAKDPHEDDLNIHQMHSKPIWNKYLWCLFDKLGQVSVRVPYQLDSINFYKVLTAFCKQDAYLSRNEFYMNQIQLWNNNDFWP